MKYWSHSVTLIEGCTPISPGCDNCWSASFAWKFGNAPGMVQEDSEGKCKYLGNIRIREDRLPELLRGRKPRVIQIWNDLFHHQVPNKFIWKTIDTMLDAGQHTFCVLTKRPERFYCISKLYELKDETPYLPENIYVGVTCESQKYADEKIPYLLQVPGKRWLSIEPLLEEINLFNSVPAVFGTLKHKPYIGNIHQVIVGCETGKNARLCEIEWIESIVWQCKIAKVPCFVKAINLNGKITSDITKFPESLRVRDLAWKE